MNQACYFAFLNPSDTVLAMDLFVVVYLGEINHRDKSYPGEHQPIIDPRLFEAVQTKLTENRQERRLRRQSSNALLMGKLFDDRGNPMKAFRASMSCLVGDAGIELMAIAGWRPFKTRDPQESNGRDVLRIDSPSQSCRGSIAPGRLSIRLDVYSPPQVLQIYPAGATFSPGRTTR